jgi:hypothetical protein
MSWRRFWFNDNIADFSYFCCVLSWDHIIVHRLWYKFSLTRLCWLQLEYWEFNLYSFLDFHSFQMKNFWLLNRSRYLNDIVAYINFFFLLPVLVKAEIILCLYFHIFRRPIEWWSNSVYFEYTQKEALLTSKKLGFKMLWFNYG